MKNYTFEEWFALLGIKHFTGDEFTSYFHVRRRGVTNSPPPAEMWENIAPTIKIVDELRAHLGRPIVLLSSYRSPAYNAAIDGRSIIRNEQVVGSNPLAGSSFDLRCAAMPGANDFGFKDLFTVSDILGQMPTILMCLPGGNHCGQWRHDSVSGTLKLFNRCRLPDRVGEI